MTVDPEAVHPARELPVVVAGAILGALVLFWPLPLHLMDSLVTIPTAEGPEHVWRWWVAGQVGVPWGGFFPGLNHPDGLTVHVVDPLHALLALVLGWWWGGPAAGLAVVQVAGVVVGAVAGWLLAAETGADRAGRLLGTAAGLAIPTVIGSGLDGITEGLGLAWTGVQLALLLRLTRTRARWDVLGFAVALGCAAWSGPYTLVFSALIDGVVGVAVLRRTRLPIVGGLMGSVLASPVIWAAWSLVDQGPGGALRGAVERPPMVAAWRGAWREGADLFDVFLPSWVTGHCAEAPTTGYLGFVWVAVVGWGLLRAARGGMVRRVLPWLLGGTAFCVLALGPFVVVGGEVLTIGTAELWAPAAFLEQVPVLERLSRWYRAAAVAVLLLIPVATHAVRGRSLAFTAVIALMVVVDARSGSPASFPGPTVSVPEVDWSVVEGPIAELPAVHPLGRSGSVADQNLLLQTLHGQPTSGTIDARPGAATDHPGVRVLSRVMRPDIPDRAALVVSARRQLVRDGYRSLLVYADRLPPGARDYLTPSLGPGRELAPGLWLFPLK